MEHVIDPIILEKSAKERKGDSTAVKTATLAERIALNLPKSKGQRILIRAVGQFNYRANWFSLDETENAVKTWKIVDSRFFFVEESGKSLIIHDRTIK